MADLTITTTQVLPGTGAKVSHAIAGEAITPGQSIYIKSTDSKAYKADADAVDTAAAKGVAVSSALAAGQYVAYQYEGPVTIGAAASVAQGQTYVVSGTAGGIAPESDLTTGDYVTIIGVGNASDQIVLGIRASGVAHV